MNFFYGINVVRPHYLFSVVSPGFGVVDGVISSVADLGLGSAVAEPLFEGGII